MATKTVAVDDPRSAKRTALVRRLDTLGYLLDNSIPIPGTGARVGLDAVIGLIPGIGDAAGAILSGYIVIEGARLGAGFAVILRMLLNIAIETVVGAIPLLGDLFDAGWKANEKNLRLLHAAIDSPTAARRTSWLFVGFVLLVILGMLAGIAWVVWWLLTHFTQPATW